MEIPKNVVAGGSEKRSPKEYKIKKDKDQEVEAYLLFDSDVDYEVEKLRLEDLPSTFENKRVTWFVNFSVRYKGGGYISGVTYSLLFPALSDNTTLVIFDGNSVTRYRGSMTDRRHDNKQLKEIRLSVGDPGGGTIPGS